jgi:hypothetical protein
MLAKQVVENCTERKSEVYIYSPEKLSKLATTNSCKLKYLKTPEYRKKLFTGLYLYCVEVQIQ